MTEPTIKEQIAEVHWAAEYFRRQDAPSCLIDRLIAALATLRKVQMGELVPKFSDDTVERPEIGRGYFDPT